LLDLGDGKPERLRFETGKVTLERFESREAFANKPPILAGVGTVTERAAVAATSPATTSVSSTNQPATPPPSFASRLATTAEARYNKSLATASQQYLGDLDSAQKAAMRAGNLDEANAIRDAVGLIKAGKLPGAQFKSVFANTAKIRYEQSASVAVQQYLRELDAAQKAAMNAGNLDEANAISAVRKQLERK